MKYYSAIKKNEVPICVTTWINITNIMPNERSQVQKG